MSSGESYSCAVRFNRLPNSRYRYFTGCASCVPLTPHPYLPVIRVIHYMQADAVDSLASSTSSSSSTSKPSSSSPSNVVAIGDSLPHDILGAIRANISSVFVAGGVHFEELGIRQGAGEVATDAACVSAFERHLEGKCRPNHTVSAFRW